MTHSRRMPMFAAFLLAAVAAAFLVPTTSDAKIFPHVWKLSARQSCVPPLVCLQCCDSGNGGACFQEKCGSAIEVSAPCTPVIEP
jgi:hypothetical protein